MYAILIINYVHFTQIIIMILLIVCHVSVSDALLRSVVDAGQPSEVPAGKWYEVTPPSEDGSLPSPSFNKDINVHCVGEYNALACEGKQQ